METFVVRVWVPVTPGEDEGLRGIVEHVRSGHSSPFRGSEELVKVIASTTPRTSQLLDESGESP